jgi:hypothetical protein
MDSMKPKPGDKVRLKRLASWVTPLDAAMVVKHVGDFPSESGMMLGAVCVWISSHGEPHERVYPIEELVQVHL